MQRCLVEVCKWMLENGVFDIRGIAISAVKQERINQDLKWGVQNHSWAEWATILGEEYGEFCEAVNETVLNNKTKFELGGYDNMLKEAIHTAAVAVEIIEKLLEEIKREQRSDCEDL